MALKMVNGKPNVNQKRMTGSNVNHHRMHGTNFRNKKIKHNSPFKRLHRLGEDLGFDLGVPVEKVEDVLDESLELFLCGNTLYPRVPVHVSPEVRLLRTSEGVRELFGSQHSKRVSTV